MAEFDEKRLNGHPSIPRTTPPSRVPLVIGSPFLVFGLLIMLVDLFNPPGRRYVNAPVIFHGFMALIGLLMALLGAGFAVLGARGWIRQARLRKARELTPGEPWNFEPAWSGQELHDQRHSHLWLLWATTPCLALFLLPMNILATNKGIWFGNLGLVVLLIVAVHGTWRRLKDGRGCLRLAGFPCFLGEPFTATFVNSTRLHGARNLRAALCCFEERLEVRTPAWFQIWADRQEFKTLRNGREIELRFPLPSGSAYSTSTDGEPRRFWVLEIVVATAGPDLRSTFLVPVYAAAR